MPDGEASTKREDIMSSRRPNALPMSANNLGDDVDSREFNQARDGVDGQQQTSSSRSPFADRRNFVKQLCDVSLLAANVSQFRVVFDGGSEKLQSFYIPLLVIIGLSLLLHIVFGFLMIQRWRMERAAELSHKKSSSLPEQAKGVTCSCSSCLTVERCDDISMFIMLIIVVLNVFIAGLGLSGPPKGGATGN
ncbi:uncharacterized protein LOC134240280 isoform X3 [Saccostrea cucullata]|uniref:uncharacterized protein LOC134240280 isoform X3 n=1 Tax=Saccostrea cuccullata TaxID=36930 RepID=UPI002ED22D34